MEKIIITIKQEKFSEITQKYGLQVSAELENKYLPKNLKSHMDRVEPENIEFFYNHLLNPCFVFTI